MCVLNPKNTCEKIVQLYRVIHLYFLFIEEPCVECQTITITNVRHPHLNILLNFYRAYFLDVNLSPFVKQTASHQRHILSVL